MKILFTLFFLSFAALGFAVVSTASAVETNQFSTTPGMQGLDFPLNPFTPRLPPKPKIEPPPPPVQPAPTIEQPVRDEKSQPEISPATPSEKDVKIEAPSLTITGLVWNTDTPQAIVNNQIVKLGDVIDGASIQAIHREGIDISYVGTVFTITLSGENSPKQNDADEGH